WFPHYAACVLGVTTASRQDGRDGPLLGTGLLGESPGRRPRTGLVPPAASEAWHVVPPGPVEHGDCLIADVLPPAGSAGVQAPAARRVAMTTGLFGMSAQAISK